jgi:hypothetical protein
MNTESEADPSNAIPPVPDRKWGMEGPVLIYKDESTTMRTRHAVDHVLSRPELRAHLNQPGQSKEYGKAIHDALAANVVAISTHGKNGPGLQAAARLMQWVAQTRHPRPSDFRPTRRWVVNNRISLSSKTFVQPPQATA